MKHTYYSNPNLANRLYKVLFNSDKSVKEFADSIGVSKTSMYSYLQGVGVPSMQIIERICRVYDVSADWLLGLEEKNGFRSTI